MADLTTVARVKAFLNISVTDHDTLLGTLLNGVSAAMQAYMDRAIPQATYTDEKIDGSGLSDVLAVRHFPISTATAVVLRQGGAEVATGTYQVDYDRGHLVLSDGNGWFTQGWGYGNGGRAWARGRRIYGVDYVGGYATVPEDLQNAAIRQVALEFKRSGAKGDRIGLTTTTLADGTVATYRGEAWAEGVREVMDAYRRSR